MAFSNRPHESHDNYQQPGRKMFRSLTDFKRAKSHNGNGHGHRNGGKQAPPESTSAENFYYLKQMSSRTPMVIVMTDGEEIRGWIEWYDKDALKVNRDGAPNLLIRKQCIKYLFKQDELAQ